MIKAILFDFDGVLSKDKDDIVDLIRLLKDKTDVPAEDLEPIIRKHFNLDMYIGKKDFMTAWTAICKELKVSEDLLTDYIESTHIDQDMLDLAASLKSKYHTGILTTNSQLRVDMITKHFNLDFNDVFISAQFGCTKREKEIFEQVLKKLNLKPDEVIFIDNSASNLTEPKKLGILTIFYTYSETSVEELKKQLQIML